MTHMPPDATQPRRSTVRQQLRWALLKIERLTEALDDERRRREQAERDRDRYADIVARIMGVLDEEDRGGRGAPTRRRGTAGEGEG